MVAIVLMVRFWPRDDKERVPVDPTPPPLPVVAVANKDGWLPLFNSKDLDGWKRFPEEAGA